MYLISNDIMIAVSKCNKCEKCKKKKTNPLIIERHVLVVNYFCTHVFGLLNFDMDDVVPCDTKCFFLKYPYL